MDCRAPPELVGFQMPELHISTRVTRQNVPQVLFQAKTLGSVVLIYIISMIVLPGV
jgi:hypothetical protein